MTPDPQLPHDDSIEPQNNAGTPQNANLTPAFIVVGGTLVAFVGLVGVSLAAAAVFKSPQAGRATFLAGLKLFGRLGLG